MSATERIHETTRWSVERLIHSWAFGTAAAFAFVFAIATPPFQAPDEVGHFWRSYALARGSILPTMVEGRPAADVPRGVRDLVATLWVETAGKDDANAKISRERFRAAVHVSLSRRELVRVRFPAFYTPVPYLPQALACLAGDLLGVRPLVTFYAGRLLNAAAALALVAFAMRVARDRWPFLAIGILPMVLYLFGSYSPDAFTVGLAFLVIALALREEPSTRTWWLLIVSSLLLALCKPAYFLIPFLAIPRLDGRRIARILLLGGAVAAGICGSAITAQRNLFVMRTDVPTNPSAQMTNVRLAPLHFVRIVATDYRSHVYQYADHFVGHPGWLDIQLPHPLVNTMLVLLFGLALTTRGLTLTTRLLALTIVVCTLVLISLSQYLVWTAVGGESIEGIQGRYFLPIGPLMILLVGGTARCPRGAMVIRSLVVLTAVALNAVAFGMIVTRYYTFFP